MPFPGLDLGNIAAALRVTGSDPSLADRLAAEQAQPVQSPPVAPATPVPPNANAALEATGSQYRVPEQAPAPAATPPAPRFDPSMSTPALKRQQVGNQNELIDAQVAKGDIEAEGQDRSAELYGEARDEGREGVEAVKSRRDAAYERKDANTKEAYSALKAMQDQIGHPPDTSKGKVLQIIGRLLSMTRGGGDVGAGMQMLGQAMGDDVQAWERGIAGNDKIRSAFLDMNKNEDNSLDSELDQEGKISALTAATYVNALKQVAAETVSKESKRLAEELATGLENKYVEHELDLRARKAAANNAYQTMTIQQLANLEAQGKLPKQGYDVLQRKLSDEQKVRKGESEIDSIDSTAAKNRKDADAAAASGLVSIGGQEFEAPPGTDKAIISKIAEQSKALGGIQSDLWKLRAIRERSQGKVVDNKADIQEADFIMAGLPDKLSQAYGGGQAGEATAARILASIPNPTDTAWRGDPKEAYAAAANVLQSAVVSGAQSAGLKPRQVAPAQPVETVQAVPPQPRTLAPQAPATRMVNMYSKDGRLVPIREDLVEAAKRRGYSIGAPPAPSAAAMPELSNAEYEAAVARGA